MFNGFSKETADFFWELGFNNERPWFLAHKEQFERVINEPFRALARALYDELRERFPDEEFGVHISRIYRDARRLFGRGPYKDHLWFTLTPTGGGDTAPPSGLRSARRSTPTGSVSGRRAPRRWTRCAARSRPIPRPSSGW